MSTDQPVAWMMTADGYGRPPEFYTTKPDFVPPICQLTPLYAQPQTVAGAEDARDAERYRWLREHLAKDSMLYFGNGDKEYWLDENTPYETWDKTIDEAIAAGAKV